VSASADTAMTVGRVPSGGGGTHTAINCWRVCFHDRAGCEFGRLWAITQKIDAFSLLGALGGQHHDPDESE
jgi:hypothetical protein